MKTFYIGCVLAITALMLLFFSLSVLGPWYYYVTTVLIGYIAYVLITQDT